MNNHLRPLNLGETLDRTFQIYRSNFSLFTGIALTGALINLVWSTVQVFAVRNAMTAGIRPAKFQLVNGVGSYGVMFVSFIADSLVWAAMVVAVAAIYRGQPVDVAGTLRSVLPKWWRLAFVTMTAIVIAWSLPAIAFVSIFILMARNVARQNTAAMIALGVIGLSLLATIPLGIWLSLRFSLANAVAAFEGTHLAASLRRSALLIKGAKGRVFVLLCIVVILQVVLGLILGIPTWASLYHNFRHPHIPLWQSLYGLATGVVLRTLTTPVFGIGLALFYFDARARKEGLDVEWSMQEDPLPSAGTYTGNPEIAPPPLG